jgi:PRC-barrel domain protein
MRRDDVDTTPAGTATMEPAASHIAPLKDLKDYKVAKDDPDVRGWTVTGRDGRKIGEVNDLLVDTVAMRVRYLDVELDRDLLANAPVVPGTAGVVGAYAAPGMAGAGPVLDPGDGNERKRHVLIPIGMARLDEDHDRIHLDGFDAEDVTVLPAYDHSAFNREYESGLRRRFDRGSTAADRDFYSGDLYDEERFYGPRRKRRRLL